MRCEISASFFLILSLSTQGAIPEDRRIVWGTLHRDINLDISDFRVTNEVEEIRWDRGKNMIALWNAKEHHPTNESYEILKNGTLRIKHLKESDNDIYCITIYNTEGSSVFQATFDLRILEPVSKPEISWECSNTSVTCKVSGGTEPELKLYQHKKSVSSGQQKVIRYKWANLDAPFKCTASNRVSEESSVQTVTCAEKNLYIYLLSGTCGGGLFLVVCVALFIYCACKRKKRASRRNDEELEIKVSRTTAGESRGAGERCPKPPPMSATAPQHAAALQAPPPPGHRPQAPGHRPLPPSHRVHQQPKKRPPTSGTQVHQQKGPPLPRPRIQQKPPCGAAGNEPLPSPD